MLNPRSFLEDCLRRQEMSFWANGLPWQIINDCIDGATLEYCETPAQRQKFELSTGLAWDNVMDPPGPTIDCPGCKHRTTVRWTTSGKARYWASSESGAGGIGLADKEFQSQCENPRCGITITHDKLRVTKFRDEMKALLEEKTPLPGTILGKDGLVNSSSTNNSRREASFPNRLVQANYMNLLARTGVSARPTAHMDLVRRLIEDVLSDNKLCKQINNTRIAPLLTGEKIAIRRMMSRYWENSSIFGLDLVGAVIRQGSFIEKMHKTDWLHSPALASTMDNLIVKYTRYFEILAKHPTQCAVPTLDVDLAWHTHQLSPPSYHAYSLSKTQTFIDHDDKIDEGKLSMAFEWTSKTYQKMSKEVYSQCTCWYCSAVRESHTSATSRLFGNSDQAAIDDQVSALHDSPRKSKDLSNPGTNLHISAHNAVRMDLPTNTRREQNQHNQLRVVHRHQLERNYQKAIKRAKKEGRPPPEKDPYPSANIYAYGVIVPAAPGYAPYQSDACHDQSLYAVNPSCASMVPGAIGNCCQGSCGGGVAAGACAGAGAGGCAGVVGGGCGGGGFGGGCGGGGGAGGCGGGGGGAGG